MFRETIAKECRNPECVLRGQMQDKGLPICPECACELKPNIRTDKRMVAIAAAMAALTLSSGSLLGYGVVANGLSVGQTARWVMGKVTLPDRLSGPGTRGQWLSGVVLWQFKAGKEPKGFTNSFLCDERADGYWCQPRFTAASGDRMRFELSPQVDNLYVFYKDPQNPVLLYPKTTAETIPAGHQIRVPQGEEMQLSGGPTTELFLIVAAKRPLPELANLRDSVSMPALEQAVKPLASDKDCLLIYVQVPHA
jgi:hypothetical protein